VRGLNTFFPYTVCINLDRRLDRWAHMEAQFAQHHIGPVIRLSALDGETVPIPSDPNTATPIEILSAKGWSASGGGSTRGPRTLWY
jgi:hypothetical protein